MRPYSATFTEHYWAGGPAEKEFVFLQGNALPQRFAGAGAFTVAELGFGTALNFLLTAHLWQSLALGHLTYISYELEPLTIEQLTAIQASFPTHLQPLSQAFLAAYHPQPGWNTLTLNQTTLHLYIGDAATGINTQPQPADAWFLDGFSPAHNPALWTPELLRHVTQLTNPHGTFATYSAVGEVRRTLTAAGFTVMRQPGFPPKRHMLVGTRA
jgi:tRNA U34 5-methylaminomethyl-2-thiouridine-forming methyltransferase MnmC